jgi:hypothetical protein
MHITSADPNSFDKIVVINGFGAKTTTESETNATAIHFIDCNNNITVYKRDFSRKLAITYIKEKIDA